ncbi:hypothetical protein CWI75_09385 [Kineobactrum sediminis]|uniref:ABC transporter n=1 Tax=Kineobactrum sediminis TaxID=1905677 RepID=A0A2N5Y2Z3_9GAMM|nr:VacJ family lipoprotein [Kineobactrum sediminis]PLW82772.1 hypothetical protein CWI75_09385 [Kineobactrum sediminis]
MSPRRTIILLLCLLLTVPAIARAEAEADPFESINRPLFVFNDKVDEYLLRPTARGYRWVMPDPAEQGVTNFFSNLRDVNAAVNGVLQGRPANAARASGRVLLNSTIGILGLFDVASRMGLTPYRTDFGHTLAVWGFPQGPYLVVPLLGPKTVRSGTGTIFDGYTSVESTIDDVRLRNSTRGLDLVSTRARLLKADDLISGDRYIFVRDAYLQSRRALVSEGELKDDFSDFGDNGWDEEF